ncbi:MAG: CC_3452 family protein [Sphingomicrobium sp.]
MTRTAAILAIAALAAAPAVAGNYSAKPLAAPAATKIIGKDISWTCGADACQGSTDASRPLILCQDLAKHAGRLQSFVADGRALGATDLDKCNASAKGGASKALANVN